MAYTALSRLHPPTLAPAPPPPPPGTVRPSLYPGASSGICDASSSISGGLHVTATHIEYKGRSSSLALIEDQFSRHPLVRDCAVLPAEAYAGGKTGWAAPTPVTYIALSPVGRDRAQKGGEKESKKIKAELSKFLADVAPPFKQLKGRIIVVDGIPRDQHGQVLTKLLTEKGTASATAAMAGPSKGFFNTVLTVAPSSAAAAASVQTAEAPLSAPPEGSASKKLGRDSKRRATHSQIERRRREKINDRLVTLRTIVPACAKELEDRRRQRQEDEDEAARIAAGGTPKTLIDAATGKPKRKRNRKKPEPKKQGDDKDEELGLHKLEVLTHAINHIFELKARIEELETGRKPEWIPTADNPFGLLKVKGEEDNGEEGEVDADDDEKPLMQVREAAGPHSLPHSSIAGAGLEHDSTATRETTEEAEGLVAREDSDDEEDAEMAEGVDGVARTAKRRTSVAAPAGPAIRPGTKRSAAVARAAARRTAAAHDSSSSGRDSDETSPVMSLGTGTPLHVVSPGTITSLSSPMMSLSAESPILIGDGKLPRKHGFQPLPPAAMPLPVFPHDSAPQPPGANAASRRDSSSFLFKQLSLTSPNFAPFNPLSYSAASRARTYSSRSTTASATGTPVVHPAQYGAESGIRGSRGSPTDAPEYGDAAGRDNVSAREGKREAQFTTPPTGLADSDTSAAALLLNFSTSPEVLRPISSLRSTRRSIPAPAPSSSSYDGPTWPTGRAHPPLYFTSPQFRPVHSSAGPMGEDRYRPPPGSAPGGSRPSSYFSLMSNPEPRSSRVAEPLHTAQHVNSQGEEEEGDELLKSPPLLALDASSSPDRPEGRLSDGTIDDAFLAHSEEGERGMLLD